MLANKINRMLLPSMYKFASAASVDYYKLLGVGKQATYDQIHDAFSKVTGKINPDNDPHLFNKISEAFVILTDDKARDAYDSLLRSYKISYINREHEQGLKSKTKSYIADRKARTREQVHKSYNIDAFGRYKGGIPKPKSTLKGKSLGQTGQMYHPDEIANQKPFPDYAKVDAARAESFKNFHQDERQTRTIKRPWITFQVDYDFFSLQKLFPGWPYVRFLLAITVLGPVLFQYYIGIQKRNGAKLLKKKRETKKAAQQAKQAEEQSKSQESS